MLPPKKRINYSQVMSQVVRLRQLSTDTNRVSQNLDDALLDTMGIWSGDAASTYKTQCGIMIVDIGSTSRKLSDLANKIADAASDIKREDEAAESRYREYCRARERAQNQPK